MEEETNLFCQPHISNQGLFEDTATSPKLLHTVVPTAHISLFLLFLQSDNFSSLFIYDQFLTIHLMLGKIFYFYQDKVRQSLHARSLRKVDS